MKGFLVLVGVARFELTTSIPNTIVYRGFRLAKSYILPHFNKKPYPNTLPQPYPFLRIRNTIHKYYFTYADNSMYTYFLTINFFDSVFQNQKFQDPYLYIAF